MTAKGDSKFWLYSAVVCLTAVLSYYSSLECEFCFDDVSAIVENKDLRPRTPVLNLFWNDFWGTPMHKEKSHKSYRPLCVLTFRMNYAISELEPMSYHLVNVLLHALVCVLFLRVCCMFLKELPAFIAATLFAVHPVHTEAVTGVVGRAEVLSSIFYLAALMTYSRCTGYHKKTDWAPLVFTVSLVTVAMLCKEQGITVIGVCCVYELLVAQRATFTELWSILMGILQGKPKIPSWLWGSIVRCVFLVGSTLLLLFARIKVMGAQLPVFTKFDNPASQSPFPSRHLTFNYLLSVNSWLLLFPSELCCDWTMGTIPVIESIVDYRNIFTLFFYLSMFKLGTFALSKQGPRHRALIMSLTLLVLPFIPASNLFFPVGFVVAERILYAPSMGFCMLVALGFDLIIQHKKSLKSVLWLFMGFMLITQALKTFNRNYDWKSEYTIFRAALRVNKQNAKLWNNVGHALEKTKEWDKALEYFLKAARDVHTAPGYYIIFLTPDPYVQPDDIGAHINVGRTYNTLEMPTESEAAYRKAMALFPPIIPGKSYQARVAPNHLNVYLNLASLISKTNSSRLMEADDLLRQAVTMRPDYVQGYINRGDIMVKLKKPQHAIEQYELGLTYEPDNADIHYNLGVVNLELGNRAAAKKYFEDALKWEPDHWQSLYNSAIMIQEDLNVQQFGLALERCDKLLKRNSSDAKVYFTMGMINMDMRQFHKAEECFKNAILYEEDFRSALFNLALMLVNNLQRPLDAVPYLEKLIKHHPDHFKAHLLMGDINVNYQKNLDDAEKHFRKAIEIDPNNSQAQHNLCVVFVERGHLIQAEKCLSEVYKMDPKEEYILNHLNIVRNKINLAIKAQKEAAAKAQAQQAQGTGEGQGQGQPQQNGQGQGHGQQQQPIQDQKQSGQNGQNAQQSRKAEPHNGAETTGHSKKIKQTTKAQEKKNTEKTKATKP